MNRSALKKYAPQARLDFIEAVTLRARRLGLDPALPVNVEQTGDVLLIGGQPFPASVAKQRSELARRIHQQGFDAVVEALAYTWFNRLVAIRFMELKGYLSHGYRVLSHPEGQQPEILEHAQHLDLPGLDKEKVIRLKTAGNQDEALYREILLAQCHELHRNMPFLFKALDYATELLLPENLLRTDSLIARLVGDIEEADWQKVEVIGWLYQFYISEKKGEVIGKMVKSEDIPAATQLFTPNWIVQYLVQNSLGRLWLMANPHSNLKEKMPYYIEPAEQTPEVQAQLDALVKVRMDEDGGTLNPESLTVLDPACGSGHILVEAYNLLRAIYEERGYRLRDIPRLILQKNLYGLDIDDRAAQLAGFALLMKAREDDRRLFDEEGNPPHLNIMAIHQSAGLPDEDIARVILNTAIQIEGGDAFHSGQLFGGAQLETQHSSGLTVLELRQLIKLFEHGKTLGSLISVPAALKSKLGKIVDLLLTVRRKGNDLSRSYANQVLEQFACPAGVLALRYDAVVANPPYLGGNYMAPNLKKMGADYFDCGKADLFSMFIVRISQILADGGYMSLMTPFTWMNLSSYESLREKILNELNLNSLIQPEYHSFFESAYVPICMFSLQKARLSSKAVFINLSQFYGEEKQAPNALVAISDHGCPWRYNIDVSNFLRVPGNIFAYSLGEKALECFDKFEKLSNYSDLRQGLITGDNDRFLRLWHEVDFGRSSLSAGEAAPRWYPYQKGGAYRKWYGNNEYFVDWGSDGFAIRNFYNDAGRLRSRPQNIKYYLKEGLSWTSLTISPLSMRYVEKGFIFDAKGPMCFPSDPNDLYAILGYANSRVINVFLRELAPTMDYSQGPVGSAPYSRPKCFVDSVVKELIDLSKNDWDSFERSWDFLGNPIVMRGSYSLESAWASWCDVLADRIAIASSLESENNEFFIREYGLSEEIPSQVTADEISLARPERARDMQRLISYAVGCMMGRYSLDEAGLIYADSGGSEFDPALYRTFPADSDGIIPITDEPWFEDDAAERVHGFVKAVWGADNVVENMEWLANSLGRKSAESADEVVRRYLSTSFYKDHLQTYKKRPIYWLFSSGKQKAFECLVYLHRYNEGTLSRMRMEYVVPLQSRMQARIDKLTDDVNSATSSAQQKTLQRRKDKLTKQLEELRRFDENLRPFADQRITLDLDDGVKVNYGKFGNLLAEVKAVTGGKEE